MINEEQPMSHSFSYLLLFICFGYACAQDYGPQAYPVQQDFRSHQMMSSGSVYDGTVYAPFDNTTPSEQSNVGASYSPNRAPGGPRRAGENDGGWTPGWGDETQGPDTPPGQEYPLGEPWILAIFAAASAGGIALRKRNRARD